MIPHAFGERAVLKLVYAALIRAAEHWRGIRITEFELCQLRAIREEIDKDFTARTAPLTSATVAAAPTRLSSNDRTTLPPKPARIKPISFSVGGTAGYVSVRFFWIQPMLFRIDCGAAAIALFAFFLRLVFSAREPQ